MDPTALPLGLWFSAALAALPIVVVFVLLGPLRVSSHIAASVGAFLAAVLAVIVWRFPLTTTLIAGIYGVAIALFPIIYIIATSLLLYNLTVVSGWAEKLRATLEQTIPDRYLLLLLIGFGFAAFLDSTAGFLTPVTVATAVLVGLGVPAFEAGAYTLVASSLPPIFGAMGIPVVVLAEVTGLRLISLAHHQAVIAGLLFLGFPMWLTFTFGGRSALRRLWLHTVAAGLAYGLVVWWVATRISFYPAGLAASVAALLATVLVTYLTKNGLDKSNRPPLKAMLKPWWPYLLLMVIVTVWSLPAVSQWLNQFTLFIPVSILAESLQWRFNLIASAGTAILVTTLIFGWVVGLSAGQWSQAIRMTGRQIHYPVINMMVMLALAQIMNFSGMTLAVGTAVANTGPAFPLISPFLSWLGAAIAGSNTASNAILGQLQATTAVQLGLSPLKVVALAGAAAPLGKMVAPQVLSAAAGAGGITGAESRLLRVGLFHSLIWTTLIAVLGYFWVTG